MTYGGSAYPTAFIDSITVTYSRFPGCKTALRLFDLLIITFVVAVRPRAKPVSSKL
jgi:hypothetical protein